MSSLYLFLAFLDSTWLEWSGNCWYVLANDAARLASLLALSRSLFHHRLEYGVGQLFGTVASMVSITACSSLSSSLSTSPAPFSCSLMGLSSSFSASTLWKRSQSVALKFHGLVLTGPGTGKSICVTMEKWSALGGVSSGRTSHMVIQFLLSLVIKTLSGLVWHPLELVIVGIKGGSAISMLYSASRSIRIWASSKFFWVKSLEFLASSHHGLCL